MSKEWTSSRYAASDYSDYYTVVKGDSYAGARLEVTSRTGVSDYHTAPKYGFGFRCAKDK